MQWQIDGKQKPNYYINVVIIVYYSLKWGTIIKHIELWKICGIYRVVYLIVTFFSAVEYSHFYSMLG